MSESVEGAGPVLQVTDLSKNYGGLKAMDNISFSVNRGEVLALVGDNGAGKSTLVMVAEATRYSAPLMGR